MEKICYWMDFVAERRYALAKDLQKRFPVALFVLWFWSMLVVAEHRWCKELQKSFIQQSKHRSPLRDCFFSHVMSQLVSSREQLRQHVVSEACHFSLLLQIEQKENIFFGVEESSRASVDIKSLVSFSVKQSNSWNLDCDSIHCYSFRLITACHLLPNLHSRGIRINRDCFKFIAIVKTSFAYLRGRCTHGCRKIWFILVLRSLVVIQVESPFNVFQGHSSVLVRHSSRVLTQKSFRFL